MKGGVYRMLTDELPDTAEGCKKIEIQINRKG